MIRATALAVAFAALGLIAPASAQTPGGAPMAGGAPGRMPAPAPNPFRLTIDAKALAGLPRATVQATDEGGHTNTYGGVALADVLARAGAPTGMAVRGTVVMTYVVVGASDGYHALFALTDIDRSFTDRVVLLADTRDGAPFGADAGPIRLIVPGEKRDARWVKMVTDVELVNAPTP